MFDVIRRRARSVPPGQLVHARHQSHLHGVHSLTAHLGRLRRFPRGMKVMMKAGRGDTGPPGHHRVHPVRPLPQLLLSVPELADVSLPPEVLTPRSRSRSPSPSRSPRHDSSRRDTFKRAQTYSTFEASKRGWAGLVESRVLRKMVSVKRIYGEKPGLLESELGPRATVAQWARLNRSRPWWRRMVHPNSVERRAIDAMTGFLVVLSVAQVPLQVVLSWWPYLRLSATGVAIFNLAVQTWFAAELVLNLRTGTRRDAMPAAPTGATCARRRRRLRARARARTRAQATSRATARSSWTVGRPSGSTSSPAGCCSTCSA